MNGLAEQGLDEGAFSAKSTGGALKTFDAFPKTKASYTVPSRRGGQWTVFVLLFCTLLSISELWTWFRGTENYHFSVEKGVSHELQLNLDIVVKMPCDSIRVNIQDAARDRILAGDLLNKEVTNWDSWVKERNRNEYQKLSEESNERLDAQEEDAHVRHVLGEVRKNPKRKFPKSPRQTRGYVLDACRVYGSLEGNKVQGNFHITARGHGYQEFTPHLDHSEFNFSHMINELSFGPHYPTLLNPLDKTMAMTDQHYYKFQYFLSVVPTIYSKGNKALDAYSKAPPSDIHRHDRNMIFTNQYAAQSQSTLLPETPFHAPGIFFRYDIEPILLLISQEHSSLLALFIRLINTVSGVLVAGGWLYQLSGWAVEVLRSRRARMQSDGVLNGRHHADD